MVQRFLPRSSVADDVLVPVLDQIRAELGVPAHFPPEVTEHAGRAVAQWQAFLAAVGAHPDTALPATAPGPEQIQTLCALDLSGMPAHLDALDPTALPTLDATHIPLVTIDPPGSRDLDQALCLTRLPGRQEDGAAYLVTYAIASLATFIPPDSPLDREARARGLTTYLPDAPTPLHPRVLSEGAASLLPGQAVPACVWHIRLAPDGCRVSWTVRRALVRSRAQLTYDQVQDALDAVDEGGRADLPEGTPEDLPVLLREVGELRLAREAARGGVSVRVPEQEITRLDEGGEGIHYRLVHRSSLPCEEWNAQISLLTGICAAATMREAGVGILRTVPPASASSLGRLRAVARVLGVEWSPEQTYPDLVRHLEPGSSRNAAFLLEATSLFRGAGYAVFGAPGRPAFPPPGSAETRHEAIAAEYAHATAPLRRLVDRWSLEICLAACAGSRIPQWVLTSVQEVPSLMGSAGQRVSAADRESLAAIGALLLADQVGQSFTGAVVDAPRTPPHPVGATAGDTGAVAGTTAAGETGTAPAPSNGHRAPQGSGRVMIADPAVMARVVPEDPRLTLPLGEVVEVRLTVADVARRRIEFVWPADEAAFTVALRAKTGNVASHPPM